MQNTSKEDLTEWVKKIGYRLFLIKESRKQYNKFLNNYKNNKFKGLGYEFYGWVKRNYEFSIIILLAGLLEGSQRDDDLNFQKFIKNIENYGLNKIESDLLADKPKYFSDFDNIIYSTLEDNDPLEQHRKAYIENIFKNLDIKADIKNINDCFLKIKTLRDKKIAHFTDYKEDIAIDDINLDEIINNVIEIFDRYAFVISNTSYVLE